MLPFEPFYDRLLGLLEGQIAVEILRNIRFHANGLDLQMPILGGTQTAKMMLDWERKKQRPRTKNYELNADIIPELVE
jgi:hypothetical protein